ncbi:MAG: hypothetical protein AABP62_16950 [Planctomycetota bacterium]
MLDIKTEIVRLRDRLAKMEKLDAIQSDPEMAAMAREVFGGDTKQKSARTEPQTPSLLTKLIAWFKENKVESATLEEMTAGLGATKPAIRQLVYTRAKDSFEKVGTNGKRESMFKLKE